MPHSDLVALCDSLVRSVPDYPVPGVVFKDITPMLADARALGGVVEFLAGTASEHDVDLVAGMEARGFILGAPVARELDAGFLAVRKVGKLPDPTVRAAYELEYGVAEIEIPEGIIVPGSRVLVIDDVLATGGTAAATVEMIERCGGEVVALSFFLELGFLAGRGRLEGHTVHSLVRND